MRHTSSTGGSAGCYLPRWDRGSASRAAAPSASRRTSSSCARRCCPPRPRSRRVAPPRAICPPSCWRPCGSTGCKGLARRLQVTSAVGPPASGAALKDRSGQHETAAGDSRQLGSDLAGLGAVVSLQAHARASHRESTTLAMSYCISTVVRTTTGPDTCEVPASAAALAMVASFRPVSVDEEAGCFARAVVRAARPESPSEPRRCCSRPRGWPASRSRSASSSIPRRSSTRL